MYLIDSEIVFPNVELANEEPNGLLAIGGDLSPKRLVHAYQHGIFPWFSEGEPILWWSPNPRSVLFPNELKISRSLRKSIRHSGFRISFDEDFIGVISGCAQPRNGDPRTWISPDMIQAYHRLHQLNIAHSVECWFDEQLVGGLYGVALGRVFFGESMFAHVNDASKVAFVYLVKHLVKWGYTLVDCQVQTAHLDSLGARNIARSDFIAHLNQFCQQINTQNTWKSDIVVERILD